MPECIFCRLVAGEIPRWIVWEDAHCIAFLTPFPNTPGFTVIASRKHLTSYVFDLEPAEFDHLFQAAKTVALGIDRALGTARTALIAEGMGVDHAHLKLVPLHGIPAGPWRPFVADQSHFSARYAGFVTSLDGPGVGDDELSSMARRIRAAFERPIDT